MSDRYPNLRQVKVASPCHESWAGMKGDDQVRHCSSCKHNVYNLSAMTAKEAEELLRRHEGRLCVRYYKRADGTVMTKDCPVGIARARQAVRRAWMAGAAILTSMLGIGCGTKELVPEETTVGKIALPLTEIQGEPTITTGMVAPVKEPPQEMVGKIKSLAPTQMMGEPMVVNWPQCGTQSPTDQQP